MCRSRCIANVNGACAYGPLDSRGTDLSLGSPAATRVSGLTRTGFQTILIVEQCVERVGGVMLHRRRHMRVQVERDGDVGVAEHFADDLRVDAGSEEECGSGVTKVVEAQLRKSCALEHRVVRADQAARVNRPADGVGEHEMVVSPGFTERQAFSASPIPSLPTVASPVKRVGNGELEPWIAIAGSSVTPLGRETIPFEGLAVAALAELDGIPTIVYGSVLPWRQIARQAPELAPDESYAEAFERILDEQVADLMRLRSRYPGHMLVWAGDFNQSLSGPNLTGSRAGREGVSSALERLDLVPWNANSPHSKSGMCTIDLICGPSLGRAPHTELIPTHMDGRRLSDHLGYLVEL